MAPTKYITCPKCSYGHTFAGKTHCHKCNWRFGPKPVEASPKPGGRWGKGPPASGGAGDAATKPRPAASVSPAPPSSEGQVRAQEIQRLNNAIGALWPSSSEPVPAHIAAEMAPLVSKRDALRALQAESLPLSIQFKRLEIKLGKARKHHEASKAKVDETAEQIRQLQAMLAKQEEESEKAARRVQECEEEVAKAKALRDSEPKPGVAPGAGFALDLSKFTAVPELAQTAEALRAMVQQVGEMHAKLCAQFEEVAAAAKAKAKPDEQVAAAAAASGAAAAKAKAKPDEQVAAAAASGAAPELGEGGGNEDVDMQWVDAMADKMQGLDGEGVKRLLREQCVERGGKKARV